MSNNKLRNLYTKLNFRVDEFIEEEEEGRNAKVGPSCFGVISAPMPCFYFLDDDKTELPAGNYKGDYSLIKLPAGFQSVQIIDDKIVLDEPLAETRFGPIAFNIYSEDDLIAEKLFEIQSPGVSFQGVGGGACPKLMRYQNNTKQKVFKYRNHFFMPLVLTNHTTCFYAFEQEETLLKWDKRIRKFGEKKRNNPSKYKNKQLQVAAENPIVYDNILGMLIIKKAKLQKVEIK